MDGPLVVSPRPLTKSKLDTTVESHVAKPERTTSLSSDSPRLGGRRGGRVTDEDRGGGAGMGGGVVSAHGRPSLLGSQSGGSGGSPGSAFRESLSSSGRHISGAFVGRHYNSGAVTIFTLFVIALLYIFGWSNLPLGSSVSAVRGQAYHDLRPISGLDNGDGPIILVTGGAGYIGSHTSLLLLSEGFRVIIVDNLMNSKIGAIDRLQRLAGRNSTRLHFFKVDLCDKDALQSVFVAIGQRVHAVIHFAGLKAVGESVAKPVWYYDNNIYGTLNLVSLMDKYDCRRLVFSSSATVYGQPASTPCLENFPLHPESPYGRTKYFIELILQDLYRADDRWGIILLRYFNPIGAHSSGRLGEDPQGTPNNLMPYLTQVLQGKQSVLSVFGSDYPTPDGTGVRDYIHVMDLGSGHISAVRKLEEYTGCGAYNLGTGKGTSVLELVKAMERASGKRIPLAYKDRRPGDCASIYASTEKANKELRWRAQFDVAKMCEDQWRWAQYSKQLEEE